MKRFAMKTKLSFQCTKVRFASFLSGGFTTMAVIDSPERKLEKPTSVKWRIEPQSPSRNPEHHKVKRED